MARTKDAVSLLKMTKNQVLEILKNVEGEDTVVMGAIWVSKINKAVEAEAQAQSEVAEA